MSSRVSAQAREEVLDTLHDCWDRRDDIETAINGWVPTTVLTEESSYARKAVRAALRDLEETETVHYEDCRILGRPGRVKTAAPASVVDADDDDGLRQRRWVA